MTDYRTRCDACGRFLSEGAPGASWGQCWGYDMEGCPDLHDPVFRCSPCTDKHGLPPTNCAPSYPGQGRNDLARQALGDPDQ